MKMLLETDETVTHISTDAGFDSLRTFNRVFQKCTGHKPQEFREGVKIEFNPKV